MRRSPSSWRNGDTPPVSRWSRGDLRFAFERNEGVTPHDSIPSTIPPLPRTARRPPCAGGLTSYSRRSGLRGHTAHAGSPGRVRHALARPHAAVPEPSPPRPPPPPPPP